MRLIEIIIIIIGIIPIILSIYALCIAWKRITILRGKEEPDPYIILIDGIKIELVMPKTFKRANRDVVKKLIFDALKKELMETGSSITNNSLLNDQKENGGLSFNNNNNNG